MNHLFRSIVLFEAPRTILELANQVEVYALAGILFYMLSEQLSVWSPSGYGEAE